MRCAGKTPLRRCRSPTVRFRRGGFLFVHQTQVGVREPARAGRRRGVPSAAVEAARRGRADQRPRTRERRRRGGPERPVRIVVFGVRVGRGAAVGFGVRHTIVLANRQNRLRLVLPRFNRVSLTLRGKLMYTRERQYDIMM